MNIEIDNILNEKAKNPFVTPEGYFDNLSERIMSKIPESETSDDTVAVSMAIAGIDRNSMSNSDGRRSAVRVFWTSAAACVVAVIVGLATLIYLNTNSGEQQMADVWDDEEYQDELMQYSNVDCNDVYDYLAGLDY